MEGNLVKCKIILVLTFNIDFLQIDQRNKDHSTLIEH